MVYLLYGLDHFSRQSYITELTKKFGLELEKIDEQIDPVPIAQLLAPSLFGQTKLYVISDSLNLLDYEKDLPLLLQSKLPVILTMDKLDKRTKAHTQWVKNAEINSVEFALPQRSELTDWIVGYGKRSGHTIDRKIAHTLAVRLYPESGNSFMQPQIDLWVVASEIDKLLTYANDQPLTEDHVVNLITRSNATESWDIINSLAERDTKKVFQLLEEYVGQKGIDEKASLIKLNAGLAEQIRSLLMVCESASAGITDSQVLEQTGWKSGRLYIMKRLSLKFKPQDLKSILNKIYLLDKELKSSNLSGKAVLNLLSLQL